MADGRLANGKIVDEVGDDVECFRDRLRIRVVHPDRRVLEDQVEIRQQTLSQRGLVHSKLFCLASHARPAGVEQGETAEEVDRGVVVSAKEERVELGRSVRLHLSGEQLELMWLDFFREDPASRVFLETGCFGTRI
jgi:hypothetical protein